jgi:hypothetical protein
VVEVATEETADKTRGIIGNMFYKKLCEFKRRKILWDI